MIRQRACWTTAVAWVASSGFLAQAQDVPRGLRPPLGHPANSAPGIPIADANGPVAGCAAPTVPGRKFCTWQFLVGDGHMPPFGASLYAIQRVQVANGAAGQMILYHYDFMEGSDQLNNYGRRQLWKLASLLAKYPGALVIEETPNTPELAAARRLAVLEALAQLPAPPVASERVVVGVPAVYGQAGVESELVYRRQLFQAATGGSSTLAGGGARTGMGMGAGMGGGMGGGASVGVAAGFTGAGP